MKKLLSLICVFVLLISLVACGGKQSNADGGSASKSAFVDNEEEIAVLRGTIAGISKYGNVGISISRESMAENGFEFGDVVKVSFADKNVVVPYCSNYSDVDAGTAGLFGKVEGEVIVVAVNLGDFATLNGIAQKKTFEDKTYVWEYCDGIDENLVFEVTMEQKRGYYEQYVVRQLSYSNVREDYPDLSDEQFGNFRVVTTSGMGEGVLYRSATPVDPQKNRNAFVDAAARDNGITVIIDLCDDEETLLSFEGFSTSYFATTDYIALNMGLDFTQDDFKEKLAEGLRYMAENDGVYLVHCLEGKDRTGFVIALLEFLMGATYEEAEADYMVTYYNYYGVTKDEERYSVIAHSNFEKNLIRSFGAENVKDKDLEKLAADYILNIGLSEDEISALKANLAS